MIVQLKDLESKAKA